MMITETKLAKDSTRVYYKEIYEPWVQPAITANYFIQPEGPFILSASHAHGSYPAYCAFNGNVSSADNCWYSAHGVTSEANPCWICIQSPVKLKAHSIEILNEISSPVNFKKMRIEASNDKTNWTVLAEVDGINEAGYLYTVPVNLNEPGYYYYRLYFTESFHTGGVSLQNVY